MTAKLLTAIDESAHQLEQEIDELAAKRDEYIAAIAEKQSERDMIREFRDRLTDTNGATPAVSETETVADDVVDEPVKEPPRPSPGRPPQPPPVTSEQVADLARSSEFISPAMLVREYGCSPSAASKAIAKAADKGLIVKHKPLGRGYSYKIAPPQTTDEQEPEPKPVPSPIESVLAKVKSKPAPADLPTTAQLTELETEILNIAPSLGDFGPDLIAKHLGTNAAAATKVLTSLVRKGHLVKKGSKLYRYATIQPPPASTTSLAALSPAPVAAEPFKPDPELREKILERLADKAHSSIRLSRELGKPIGEVVATLGALIEEDLVNNREGRIYALVEDAE